MIFWAKKGAYSKVLNEWKPCKFEAFLNEHQCYVSNNRVCEPLWWKLPDGFTKTQWKTRRKETDLQWLKDPFCAILKVDEWEWVHNDQQIELQSEHKHEKNKQWRAFHLRLVIYVQDFFQVKKQQIKIKRRDEANLIKSSLTLNRFYEKREIVMYVWSHY